MKPFLVKVAITVECDGYKACQALIFDEWDFDSPAQESVVPYLVHQTINRLREEVGAKEVFFA
jgi:hypothetical protein